MRPPCIHMGCSPLRLGRDAPAKQGETNEVKRERDEW